MVCLESHKVALVGGRLVNHECRVRLYLHDKVNLEASV